MAIFTTDIIDFGEQPLFFGTDGRNIARLDINSEPFIDKMTKRHRSMFWLPHDVSYSQDAIDYTIMSENRREFFLKNLKFQTLLDSAATRGVLECFLPVCTSPQLESWLCVHGFMESIHSDSYAEIIKALGIDASEVFDDIMVNGHILARGEEIVSYFNNMHSVAAQWSIGPQVVSDYKKEALVQALYMLNILENILFKTSFICSFAFAENGVMEGSTKTVQNINFDETLHYGMTIYLIKRLSKDPEYAQIFEDNKEWAVQRYQSAYDADIKWVDYLYETDPGLIGISSNILKAYSLYNIRQTMSKIGLDPIGSELDNPVPWATKYLSTGNVQTALNETDGVNYLFGSLDKDMEEW